MKRKRIIIATAIISLLLPFTTGCKDNSDNTKDVSSKVEEQESKKTTESSSGLLIALASSNEEENQDNPMEKSGDNFRSLWIHSDGKKIVQQEKKGVIIAHNGNKFYELSNDVFEMKEESGYTEGVDFYSKYNYYYSYNSINSNIIGEQSKPIYTEKTFSEHIAAEQSDWLFRSRTETPWYVGSKYACVMSNYYETGGGTYRSGSNVIQMYEIETLSNIKEREQTQKLYDLLGKDVQKELQNIADKYNKEAEKSNTEIEKKIMDLDSLLLVRKEGKWIIKIPVFIKYYHEGNGSNFYNISEYVEYEGKLPSELVSHDSLAVSWKKIVEEFPDAVDAVSSPDKNLMAVLTSKELLIYKNPKEGLTKAELTIKLQGKERIILNQWATGKNVEKWTDSLQKYFKESSNDEPQKEEPKTNGIIYKNEKLGFAFTMPRTWEGKYKIEERQDGIKVYFRPAEPAPDYDGALFYIFVRTEDNDEFWDNVGEPRIFKAKGIEYIVGGPTDVRFDFNHKEYPTFDKMVQEVRQVVATIKVLE